MVEYGYSHQDIAEDLGINFSSVRTVLHRARKRLAQRAAEPPLSPVPGPGEYYVDPDAREAYGPDNGPPCICVIPDAAYENCERHP
jgi:hypothetical protein